MIESLIPRFKSLFLQLDNLLTKSAPKSRLSVPPDLVSFELFTDIIFVLDFMTITEMGLKQLSPIEHLGALLDPVRAEFVTSPRFHLIMLRVFVPFPVVLAAESLDASFESAAVGASVTLLMLPVIFLADRIHLIQGLCTSNHTPGAFSSGKIHRPRAFASNLTVPSRKHQQNRVCVSCSC